MDGDRLIRTILANRMDDDRSRGLAWRQLADVLAEHGERLSTEGARTGLAALAALRPAVTVHDRAEVSRAVARRTRFAPLIALLALDDPTVAAAAIGEAQLSVDGWAAVLPATTPLARELLRRRSDLPTVTNQALAALGPADRRLAAPALPAAGDGQIRDLVDRIARFKKAKGSPGMAAKPETLEDRGQAHPAPMATEPFAFEIAADGLVDWSDAEVRPVVIGMTFAEAGDPGGVGTDAGAVGAFRRRSEIRAARLVLGGAGPWRGEWRVDALPWFDGATGQFEGYRARARRPRVDEQAHRQDPADPAGAALLEKEQLRELVHELRSPLNAIAGFAQMIEGEMLGAVAEPYRAIAKSIIADASAIEQVIDDLALTWRRPAEVAHDADATAERGDLAAMAQRSLAELKDLIADRGLVVIPLPPTGAPAEVFCNAAVAQRLVDRLLSATLSMGRHDEVMAVGAAARGSHASLSVTRPARLTGRAAADLMDPAFDAQGIAPDAAELTLGFSLRLITSLAEGEGGSLEIDADRFTLHLPAAAKTDVQCSHGERG